MKQLTYALLCLLLSVFCNAQNNVGIGTPAPQQKLDVNGAIKIGTTTTNQAGSIRFNNGKFEGGDGTNWKAMEGLPAGTIVLSETNPNTTLGSYGFTNIGKYTIPVTYDSTLTGSGWSPMVVTSPDPYGRTHHSAFYFDNKMIIIGGLARESDGVLRFQRNVLLYNLASNTWLTLSPVPGIAPGHNKYVFTGPPLNKIYAIGGYPNATSYVFAAHEYDIASNTWTPLPVANGHAVEGFGLIWTGSKLIVWGGYAYNPNTGVTTWVNTGKSYTPGNSSWDDLSTVNAPAPFRDDFDPIIIWSGNKMIVYGYDFPTNIHYGSEYDPAANTWAAMPAAPSSPGFAPKAVKTQTGIFVLGDGYSYEYTPLPGGKWNEITNPPNIATSGASLTNNTNNKIIVWGGGILSTQDGNTGWELDLNTFQWVSTSNNNVPPARRNHSAVWCGTKLLMYGGSSVDPATGVSNHYFNTQYELFSAGTYQLTGNKNYYLFRKN